MPNFHERLAQLRKEKKMTQKQLAELLEVNTRTVQYYESGAKRPGFDAIVRLAEAFSVSTDYLLGRSDDPTPPSRDEDKHDVDPAEVAFFEWVQEHVTGMHFYDFQKAMEDEGWLKGLRVIYEKEKGRKPGQKQGE